MDRELNVDRKPNVGRTLNVYRQLDVGRKLAVLSLGLLGFLSLGAYAQDARQAMKNVREACQSDVQTLCPDAADKGPRVLGRCMRDHSNSLSDACRTSLEELQAMRKPE